MKQISGPHINEPDNVQLSASLAYSSSRSTHSSFAGCPYDLQSTTSYTSYSSRPAICHDRKSSDCSTPQGRVSLISALNSALSYSSKVPKIRTPGEDNIPALPFPMHRQKSREALETVDIPARHSHPTEERVPCPNAGPSTYQQDFSRPVYTTDNKGRRNLPDSSFYQAQSIDVDKHQPHGTLPQLSPRLPRDMNFSRLRTPALPDELDNFPAQDRQEGKQEAAISSMPHHSPPLSQRQAVPPLSSVLAAITSALAAADSTINAG